MSEIVINIEQGTIWLTQKQIAEVFGTGIPTVNKHIKNILKEGEVKSRATISKMEIVQRGDKQLLVF